MRPKKGLLSLGIALLLCLPSLAQEPAPSPIEQALSDKSYAQAVELALEALQKDQNPALFYQLGLALYGQKLYGLALEAFQEIEGQAQDFPELYYYMAWSAYLSQNYRLSQSYLDKAQPFLPPALKEYADDLYNTLLREQNQAFQNGVLAYQEERYADAIIHLTEAVKALPNSQEALLYLGASHYHLNQFSEAKPYLKKAAELDPESQFGKNALEILSVVETLADKLTPKPFQLGISVGPYLNTNLNLGGSLQANPTQQALEGLGSQLNLDMSYRFWPDSQLKYQLNFKGYLDNQETPLDTSLYNRQVHTLSVNSSYFLKDIYQVQLTTQSTMDVLGSDIFLVNSEFRPSVTVFATDRLLTRAGATFSAGVYPTVQSWSHTRFGLDLSQYIYLWNSQTWLRFFYQHQNVDALDFIQSTVNAEARTEIESRRANSRSSHQIGLSFQFPIGTPTFELGSNLTFTDYTQSEVYREFLIFNDPRTGLPLPRRDEFGRQFERLRQDSSLSFYATLNVPLDEHWSLKAQYQRLTNVSNILPDVIPGRNYNYLLDEVGLLVRYEF